MRPTRWAAVATILGALACAPPGRPPGTPRPPLRVDPPSSSLAGDLLALRVTTMTGETRTLDAELGGTPAVLGFSATYCAPCRLEVPVLARATGRLGREGFRVVGVVTDGDDPARVARAIADWGVTYETVRVASGQEDRLARLLPRGLPATFVVGPAGALRHDALLDDDGLDALVRRLPRAGAPG